MEIKIGFVYDKISMNLKAPLNIKKVLKDGVM